MPKRRSRNKRTGRITRVAGWALSHVEQCDNPEPHDGHTFPRAGRTPGHCLGAGDPVIAPYTASCGDTEPHLPHLWSATLGYQAQCLGKKPKNGQGIAGILKRVEQLPPAPPLDYLPKKGVSRP